MVNAYISNSGAPTSVISVIDVATNIISATTITVGDDASEIVVSADGSTAYVANYLGASISFINTATNAVSRTVSFSPNAYPSGMAVTADGKTLYVAIYESDIIYVIDTATGHTIQTLGITADVLAITPDGSKIYATDPSSGINTVHAIDTISNTVSTSITVGSEPLQIAVNPNGSQAYVVNFASGTVSVIDIATNTVSATITIGSSPAGIAFSPSGAKAYVAYGTSTGEVAVINTSTNTVSTTIAVGSHPNGVAFSPDGTKAYVLNTSSGTISVINAATDSISTSISISGPWSIGRFIVPGAFPLTAPTYLPYAYIPNSGSGTISVISLTTGAVTSVAAGTTPTGVAMPPGSDYIYIVYQGSNAVALYNATSNTIVGTVGVGTSPFGIAASPNGLYIFVANQGSNSVSVISTSSFTVTHTITTGVGNSPTGIAVSPDNTTLYVTNYSSGTVSVFNAVTYALITTVTVGTNPYGVAFSPDGTEAYVANQGSNSISVINTSTHAVTTITTGVGSEPTSIAFNIISPYFYVTNYNSGTVSVFTITGTFVTAITVGTNPFGLSFSPNGSLLYVANYGSNTISVINTISNTTSSTITLASGSNPIAFGQFIQPPSIPMPSIYLPPQGRLTLTSGVPVMTADATAQTSVYYTPYQGNIVPIYDGANMNSYAVSQLTMALNTTNQLSGKIYDLFIFLNSGVVTIGAGPAWSSTTARGTGSGTTQLQQINGLWVNANTITLTNGSTSYSSIPVGQATYVGSVYMTANGQTAMQFKPTPASGGSSNVMGLYNGYNRIPLSSLERDSTVDWTYATATWQTLNNGTGSGLGNRVTVLDGLQQSPITVTALVYIGTSAAAAAGAILDSTTATPNIIATAGGGAVAATVSAIEIFTPQMGLHYFQAMQWANGATATYFGEGEFQGLTVSLEM